MRTKALLVDAHSGAQGPNVTLEHGVWEIASHPFVQVVANGPEVEHLEDKVRIIGPVKVALNVNPKYVGPPISIQAEHVEAA